MEYDDGAVNNYSAMNEVIPGLWLGDLRSAQNTDLLKEANVHSVLTAMRGTVRISETFHRLQVSLDDSDDEDLLKHLATAVAFIQAELDKGRGVLVHCMAGISRSTSIVTAYLMYSQGLTPEDALAHIRQARPVADPNDNFIAQLQIFHKASCVVSKHDKATRMFYLERMVKGIVNGDATLDSEALPSLPSSTSERSRPTTHEPRRRIRCRMCRTELASKEFMVDHGQFSAPSPAVSFSPVAPSPLPLSPSRATPAESPLSQSYEEPSALPVDDSTVDEAEELGRQLSEEVTRAETEDPPKQKDVGPEDTLADSPPLVRSAPNPVSQCPGSTSTANARPPFIPPSRRQPPSSLSHPSNISAQLYSNPVLAGLRPGLTVVPTPSPSLNTSPRPNGSTSSSPAAYSPSNLISPKCSGYFVEPLKWMEAFLEKGDLSGKIFCPNKKCNAKLGNYDWAGVCCSCKEWVVPGFCIHRSKVDEIV